MTRVGYGKDGDVYKNERAKKNAEKRNTSRMRYNSRKIVNEDLNIIKSLQNEYSESVRFGVTLDEKTWLTRKLHGMDGISAATEKEAKVIKSMLRRNDGSIKRALARTKDKKDFFDKARKLQIAFNNDTTVSSKTKIKLSSGYNFRKEEIDTTETEKIVKKFGTELVNLSTGTNKVHTQNGDIHARSLNNDKFNISSGLGNGKLQPLSEIKKATDRIKQFKSTGKGEVISFDLETFGGANSTTNVNRMSHITEYAFIKNKFDPYTKKALPSEVATAVMGIDIRELDGTKKIYDANGKKVNNKNILAQIERAMKNGTLKDNGEYGVMASRLAKYGLSDIEFDRSTGLYVMKNFPGDEDFNNTVDLTIENVKKGAEKLNEIYKFYEENKIEGLRRDQYHLLNEIIEARDKANRGDAVLAGFNQVLFDTPYLNQEIVRISREVEEMSDKDPNKKLAIKFLKKNFGNNVMSNKSALKGIDPKNGTSLDLRAMFSRAAEEVGVSKLYSGNEDLLIDKVSNLVLRQEFLAEAFLPEDFRRAGAAHRADADTEMVAKFITAQMSDEVKEHFKDDLIDKYGEAGYKNYKGSVLDFILNDIKVGKNQYGILSQSNEQEISLDEIKKKVFKINKDVATPGFTGKGQLNFVTDNDGKITFAGNVQKNALGNVEHSKYTNQMLNKNQFYRVEDIREIDITKEMARAFESALPEYANNKLYSVSLGVMTSDKNSADANKTYVRIFKTFDEMNAFLNGNLDYVADIDENGNYSIADGADDVFKIVTSNGKDIETKEDKEYKNLLKDRKKYKNDPKKLKELDIKEKKIESNRVKKMIDFENNKTSFDRSRRSFFNKYNTFEKMYNAVELDKIIKDETDIKDINGLKSFVNKHYDILSGVKQDDGTAPAYTSKIREALLKISGFEIEDVNGNKIKTISRESIENTVNMLDFINGNYDMVTQVVEAVKNNTVANIKDDGTFEYFGGQSKYSASEKFNLTMEEIIETFGKDKNKGKKDILMNKDKLKNIYDLKVSTLGNGKGKTVKDGPIDESDILTLNIKDKSTAKYNLAEQLVRKEYSKEQIKNASTKTYEEYQKLAMEKFLKENKDLGINFEEVKDFNIIDISEKVIEKLQTKKDKNFKAGLIKDRNKKSLLNLQKNMIDNKRFNKALKRNPNLVNEIVENQKVKSYIQLKEDDISLGQIVDDLADGYIHVSDDDIETAVNKTFNFNLSKDTIDAKDPGAIEYKAKSILRKNTEKEVRNILRDTVLSIREAGGDILIDNDTGHISAIKGKEVVNIGVIPELRMDDNGMMYLKVGTQKVKLENKLYVKDDGSVELGTNINDLYRKSNRDGQSFFYHTKQRVRREIEDGTFEFSNLEHMLKINLKELSEESKMIDISPGDLYSNMILDVSEFIQKGMYGMFSKKLEPGQYSKLQAFAKDLEENKTGNFFSKDFLDKFKEKYGSLLSEEGEINHEALLYMARELPMMTREYLDKYGSEDARFLGSILSSAAKEKEMTRGKLALGKRRHVVTLADIFNNQSRPVSAAAGHFRMMEDKIHDLNVENPDDYKYPLIKKREWLSNSKYKDLQEATVADKEFTAARNLKTLNLGDLGLNMILNEQAENLIKERGLAPDSEEAKRISEMFAEIRPAISVFEQENIMNPMTAMRLYGNDKTATTKYYSKSFDIISSMEQAIKNKDSDSYKTYSRIMDLLPEITKDEDTGEIIFKSADKRLVKRSDKVFEYMGHGDIVHGVDAKLNMGLMGFGAVDKSGVRLDDEMIMNIMNSDEFKDVFKDIDFKKENADALALNKLLQILEQKDIKAQFYVDSVNKNTLQKFNKNSSEKSMTYTLYAKTGMFDERVDSAFSDIENLLDIKGVRKNTVLTESAIDTFLNEYLRTIVEKTGDEITDEAKEFHIGNLLSQFEGENVEEKIGSFKKAIFSEQLEYGKLIFSGKLFDIDVFSNDNIRGHGNEGSIVYGKMGQAISVLSKYMNDGEYETEESYNNAIKFVIDKMNQSSDDKYENIENPFSIFKRETFEINTEEGTKEVNVNALKVNELDGSITYGNEKVELASHDVIDYDALNRLLEEMDLEVEKRAKGFGIERDTKDKIINSGYYMLDKEGNKVKVTNKKYASVYTAFNVAAGTITVDTYTEGIDPEYSTSLSEEYLETLRKKTTLEEDIDTYRQTLDEKVAIRDEKINNVKQLNQEITDRINELGPKENWTDEEIKEIDEKKRIIKKAKIERSKASRNVIVSENKIKMAEDEHRALAEYIDSSTSKMMRYSNAEERIMKSNRFDDVTANKINARNEKEGVDLIEMYAPEEFKEKLLKDESGKYYFKEEEKKGAFDKWQQERLSEFYYKEGYERELTDADVGIRADGTFDNDAEFAHLRRTYQQLKDDKYLNEYTDGKLGRKSVQNIYDLQRIDDAILFNGYKVGGRRDVDLNELKANGFKVMDLRDLSLDQSKTDIESINGLIGNPVVLDLGENFKESKRYIAVPGGGSFLGEDGEHLERWQKSVKKLKRRHDELLKYNGEDTEVIDGVSKAEAKARVEEAAEEVQAANLTAFEKHGIKDTMSKREIKSPSNRLKITGINNMIPDTILNEDSKINKTLVDAFKNKSMLGKAQINGRSILDWESKGIEFHYQFVGENIFRDNGYFDKKTLEIFGMNNEEEMKEYLKVHGTMHGVERYPGIYDTSMAPVRTFFNENFAENAAGVSKKTMRSYNGDVDGDSQSSFLIQSKNKMNFAIYEFFKDKNLEESELRKELEDKGFTYEDDYEFFKDLSAYSFKNALVDNEKWSKDVDAKTAKDYQRSLKYGEQRHGVIRAKALDEVHYGILKVADDDVNNMLNDAVQMYLDLGDKAPDLNDMGEFGHVIKKIQNEHGVDNLREFAQNNNIKITGPESMKGSSLIKDTRSFIENYAPNDYKSNVVKNANIKDLVGVQGDYAIGSDYRLMVNDIFIEQNNKTAKDAIGSINVKLDPIRNASRMHYGSRFDQAATTKDIMMQVTATVMEQDVISAKKNELINNMDSIEELKKAIGAVTSGEKIEVKALNEKGKPITKQISGKQALIDWTDKWMNDSHFNSVYDTVFNSLDKSAQMNFNRHINSMVNDPNNEEEVMRAKRNYIKTEFANTLEELSRDEDSNFELKRFISSKKDNYEEAYNVKTHENTMRGQVYNVGSKNGDIIDNYEQKLDKKERQRQRSGRKDWQAENTSSRRTNGADIDKEIFDSSKHYDAPNTSGATGSKVAQAAQKGVEATVDAGKNLIKKMGHGGLRTGLVGLAAGAVGGLMLSGFAGGNPLRQDNATSEATRVQESKPQSIPEFFENEGGYATTSPNGGYIINVKADTKKGRKQLEKTMKRMVEGTVGQNVSVNMSIRDKSSAYSRDDIEKWVEQNM